MRLAVFVDHVYRFDGERYSTDEPYVLFPASFDAAFDEVIFLGRVDPRPGREAFALSPSVHSVCPLPYYETLYALWRGRADLLRRVRRAVRAEAGCFRAIESPAEPLATSRTAQARGTQRAG